MWKNIWQTRNSPLAQAKWQVGRGDSIRLRDSLWYKPRSADHLDLLQLQYGTVKDLMDPISGNWNSNLINTVYNRTEAEAILSTTFSKFGNIDKVIWPFSSSGEYQVKKGYKMLIALNQENANRCLLSCGKFVTVLPTRTELAKRQIITDDTCAVCGEDQETLDHLFMSCHFARAIWYGAAQGLRTHFIYTTDMANWMKSQIENCNIKSQGDIEILTEQGAILWTIWKTRNRAIFERLEPDIHQALHTFQRLKSEWMQAMTSQEQHYFDPQGKRYYKNFSNCKEWQILIIIGNKNLHGNTNWDGGAFVIKNHLGQSVKKGCFSWHTRNKKTSNLLTIHEALYTAWKEGYRKAILFVSSENLVDELATINTNNKEAEILLEDIRTEKRMFQSLQIKVAHEPIFKEVQQLAKMATQSFIHTL
ncbi:uncharacterized protein LOC115950416 [Quercus lobata]|uniref:uncharacterized protein LOC115950416 n=1 Tax=Quercus lobata TaxID=97700 RepID=UPI001248FEEA|nr:uncharacterized protein LOC115950416 [Quercus lobata]